MSNTTDNEQQYIEHPWLHRLINRRSYKISVFIIVFVLNIVDLLVDWYFFMSKATIQKGLVFGPPPRNTLLAIFIFCIISTFTSLLEIIQVIRDAYQNRLTSLFGQITNCLTLWFEDVPLLTLNLLIVICRDGEVTYISLTKAIIGIIAALIRFLSILLNKWLIRHDYQRKDKLSKFFNTTSTIGIIIVFIISISINIIASLPIDNFGRLYLEKPSDFQEFKFAHQKYFNNVGIFLRSSDKYIYLTDIDNIIEQHSRTFIYSKNENENIFCIKQFNQTCFKELNDTTISSYDQQLTNKLINYTIKFQFKQPDFYYLLGDINYNIIRCDLKDFYIDDDKISLHYYRFKQNFNQTKLSVVLNNNNTYRYYDVNNDFDPVEYLWRTGLSRCSSTSSYSPHRSQEIQINNCF
ncbi:unnamed protein product [Adineta steineri]|uniref:Uncharacterized protein n=1 Tax=Adineta steineri TaxID=433720 RepID=A0A813X1A3_9BILA|nr:unnamed protein product [Adineta steineri]CAF0958081.1 unnamed protein product [Adineta steineri]CAF0964786.1 unnamed protein product [Adineta steineri]CAF3915877.1 unnamed protein product [Adineta steineri]